VIHIVNYTDDVWPVCIRKSEVQFGNIVWMDWLPVVFLLSREINFIYTWVTMMSFGLQQLPSTCCKACICAVAVWGRKFNYTCPNGCCVWNCVSTLSASAVRLMQTVHCFRSNFKSFSYACILSHTLFTVCWVSLQPGGVTAPNWPILPARILWAPEYEVDVTTRNGVIAHFTWIHYVPVWLRSLTYFRQIGSCDQDHILKICAYFEVYTPLRFWYIRS